MECGWSQGRVNESDECSWRGGVEVGVREVESSSVCRTGGVEVKVQEAPALLRWIRELSGFHEWGNCVWSERGVMQFVHRWCDKLSAVRSAQRRGLGGVVEVLGRNGG